MESAKITAIVHTSVIPLDVSEPVLKDIELALGVPVERSPINQEPPAAGMSELAMILEIAANSIAIGTFLIGLGMAVRGSAGEHFRTLLETGKRSRTSGRAYTALSLRMELEPHKTSVWAHFHGEPDPEELAQQFESLAETIKSLTESDLVQFIGPPENGYFWDDEDGRWRKGMTEFARQQLASANPDSATESSSGEEKMT